MVQVIKAPAEVCPICEGTGWKTAGPNDGRSRNDRRVTRCDCQLRARGQSLLAAARIPRRYEHCELSNYDTDFPGAHPSLAEAHFVASNFAKKCDPRGDKGLLITTGSFTADAKKEATRDVAPPVDLID